MSDKQKLVIDGITFRCDDFGTWERQTTGGVWAVVVNYWTEWLLDHVETMQDRLAEAEEAARAYQDLSTCYRIGKRPSEKLFTRLDKARAYFEKEESSDETHDPRLRDHRRYAP